MIIGGSVQVRRLARTARIGAWEQLSLRRLRRFGLNPDGSIAFT